MATAEHILHATTVEKESSILDRIAERTQEIGARYMPTLTVKQFSEREKLLGELKQMLVEKVDYGVIPGTDKPVLLLPGAQKLCTFFGYAPHYSSDVIEDWDGKQFGEPLFYYKYTCVLSKDGQPVGEGQGSCNSWESKYRYRWVTADKIPPAADVESLLSRGGVQTLTEPDFAVDKSETGGKYGKPIEYWQMFRDAIANGTAKEGTKEKKGGNGSYKTYSVTVDTKLYRVPNDQFADIINTCQKMGQKRAYVAATLSATGASQYFTQDLEESDETLSQVTERRLTEERVKATVRPDSPELSGLLAKLNGKRENDDAVMGSLCESLDKASGGEGDAAWARALNRHGDPAVAKNGKSLEIARNIVRSLYNDLALMRADLDITEMPS